MNFTNEHDDWMLHELLLLQAMARNQEVKKQLNVLKKIYGKCKETQLESNVTDSGSCGLYWDGMYCWPRTAIGTDSIQQCPSYVEKFNNEGLMKRYCTENGTWIKDSNHTYDDCWKKQLDDITLTEEYLDEMKVIAVVGYSVSLLTLLIACFVLIIHPKLRCPRNDLHLNLFTSFVIRCVSCICKDYLLTNGSIGFIWTVSEEFPHGKPDIGCKFLISVWHYSLMVNYSWILMEGLYLHNLIFLGFFNERAGIGLYTKLGWSLPLPFLIVWISLRATIDDKYCWTAYYYEHLEWILRAPITLSIIVNFIFYIMVVVVLYSRLNVRANQTFMGNNMRYTRNECRIKKWIKSTLILVPLFGTYYIIFLIMSFVGQYFDQLTMVVWLFCDTTASSFQGFFVAILYCFMNSEVRKELLRKGRSIYRGFANQQSFITQSLSMKSRNDNKKDYEISSKASHQYHFSASRL